MHKAIGLITCASVMAVSLYLFSGGDPSRTLSAQTEKDSGYGAVAKRLLQNAREQAEKGNTAEARRLAKSAASLSADWSDSEETPEEFLASLDQSDSEGDKEFAFAEEGSEEMTEEAPQSSESSDSEEANPFEEAALTDSPSEAAEAEEAPVTSAELLKRRQAQRLVKEARGAMSKGDTETARSRAMQARKLNASWGLWDDRPEHVLADIDAKTKSSTFVAGGKPAAKGPEIRSKETEHTFQEATALLKKARAAMDAGKLAEAQQLAEQAEGYDVAYGMFDDSPAHVMRDIQRLEEADKSADQTFASAESDASPEATQARKLLREAREALIHGRLSVAREKAMAANNLNVAYNVLDDRPDLVLQDVDAAMRGQGRSGKAAKTNDIAAAESASRPEARDLVKNARQALAQGDYTTAEELAIEAQQKDSAYGLLEDRPELVLEEAQLMAQRDQKRNGNRAIARSKPVDVTPGSAGHQFAASDVQPATFDGSEFPALAPEGESAAQAYKRGITLMRSGNRPAAKEAFSQAWKNAGELSNNERRQLQDFLQDLASTKDVQLASGQESAPADETATIPELPMDPMNDKDPLTAAVDKSDVQYDRLRTEVMNSVFRAEKLKTDNPDEALQILDNTLATVEAAPLNKESQETLAGYVRRSQETIRAYREQQAPNIARDEKNQSVMEAIKNETETKIRIEQEYAELVESYNQLMKERRYAEAELTAKKAQDLNPSLPQSTIMVEKAKLQRQIAFNADVRERKADGVLKALNDVEEAMVLPGSDYAMPDARSWDALSQRREKYGRTDARERTESELQIEKSLGQKVSLHFHDVPLTEVIRHIATVHGINITMKTRAIETEGLTATQPVSIDVDGITLQSALNLLLDQAGGLVYSIENETLMITNRLEQDTKQETRAYNVADLVIPVGLKNGGFGSTAMPTTQPLMKPGEGFFQVNDDLAVNISGNGRPGSSGSGNSESVSHADFSGLINLITTTVEPGTWDVDGGNGTIGTEENTLSLVIRQTSAVHEQIADLLKQLRKLQDLQVAVEVRFISVSDNFFERIGVDFDFNVQDSLGDVPGVPAFGSRQLTFPGGAGQNGGGQNGGQNGGDLRGNQNQGGQGGQGGQQNQAGAQRQLFDPVNRVNPSLDNWRGGQVVGMSSPNSFTQDYDVQFRQGSFEIGVPDFGGFQPNAGIQVGMAILSDIEAFFFIQAAQGDSRSNIMTAPKVTMYNGQSASVSDQTLRYLVVGQTPNVAPGAVGFQPTVQPFPDGVSLFVTGVVSADRRYVRLSMLPQFSQIIDVQTFTNVNAGGAGIQGGQGGFGGGGGGFGGGGGGFGGGGGGGQFGFGGIGGGFGGQGGQGGGQGGFGGGGQQGQQGQAGGQSGTVQLPVISTFNVGTVVSVPDGGTVLLGGIKRLREGRNMAGVPILNKIPYISRLFKNSGVGRETESIMLMVTPRIIIQEEEEELISGTAAE
ncbi:MAG: hypothetical protein JNM43_19000 [Planctomycetaceae bacterium]|nr:hypothetical protein [Planctomycetaceae bacterium]